VNPMTRSMRLAAWSAWLAAFAFLNAAPAADEGIPHLRKQGTAMQLVVDAQPFLVIGGELHNSSSSSLEYMQPIWQKMLDMHFNTVLAGVSWELVEPEEGRFDFSLVDGLIQDARRHGLRLVFLWFGSWKNGMSSYIPAWVKRDYRRFPRVKLTGQKSVEVLSTLADANWQADAKAFGTLMRHIRAVDGADHTVLMMQVENEVGVLRDSRDRSAPADAAFAGPLPSSLIEYLKKNRQALVAEIRQRWEAAGAKESGNWQQVFGEGPETDELFMAWNYARYVDRVAEAGKAQYAIPMYVNTWLSGQGKPGQWPSGGPLPHVMDMWLAGAPHIDVLSPDIYAANFQDWCRKYTERGNPLFIPEMNGEGDGPRNVFVAIGDYSAMGTSPFAVDSIENGKDSALARSYGIIRQIAPLVLQQQGTGRMAGFSLDKSHPTVTRELGDYQLQISLDEIFGSHADSGYGLIVAVGPNEFAGAGSGFRVSFRPVTQGPPLVGVGSVDEGAYRDGKWIAGRRLNGDENDQGQYWRFAPQSLNIERCMVYRYE
jgi:beta-galactosidase GanA